MKKIYSYRYYGVALLGLLITFIGAIHARSNWGAIIWGFGIYVAVFGVLLQLDKAPNFKK